jgi:anhydro-N-acetylmuramic acid kinase
MRVLGLMSGTSADGVDAVLAEFSGPSTSPRWSLINHVACPYPSDLRKRILAIAQGQAAAAADMLELTEAITEQQAKAAETCDPNRSASLVGCHGQTIWHRPPECEASGTVRRGSSWQMLQGPLLAQMLQRPVIHDFRAADLALGGQGAPLVPMADAALLGRIEGWRALLNLGGIANLTLIPPSHGPDRKRPVLGWDCGPANSLIDLAMAAFSDGQERCDKDGGMAALGQVLEEPLRNWLREPYFLKRAPKSTGRELFGQKDLERRLSELQLACREDQMATLTAFSAAVVAQDLQHLSHLGLPLPAEMVVAGGGRRNQTLMRELQSRCRGLRVRPSDELDLPCESREALVFALLAWWHHRNHPGNAPSITGAERSCVLGVRAEPA